MKDFTPEIIWQSEGKTPAGDPFFQVKKARGYYIYGERGGKDSIFFILYNKNGNSQDKNKKFSLIYEAKPPLDERTDSLAQLTTAFGGSIDMNKSKEEICQIEVEEEAGYKVPLDNIHFIGKTMVSTQMNQYAYGYLVDITSIRKTRQTEAEIKFKDPEFNLNKIVPMTKEEVFDNQDWKSIYIMTQSIHKQIIEE